MQSQPLTNNHDRLIVLVIVTVTSFLVPFMASSVIIALPAIGRHFQMDAITLTWVTAAYILTSAALLVPLGRLSDIRGRKIIFITGYGIFFLSCLASIAAPSSGLFLVSRVIQGVGASAIIATSVAILTSAFPRTHRGRVIGISAAAVYIGLSVGPVLGGLLTEHLGWESIFWISAALCLAMTLAAALKLQEYTEPLKEHFDLVGTVIYAATLTTFMYGLSIQPDILGVVLVGVGICGGVIFLFWEHRTAAPLVDVSLFRQNRSFTFSSIAALVHYSGTWSIAFLLSLYLQYTQGLTAQAAGLILITSPLVQALFSPFFGKLSDRIEPRLLASAGMAVTSAGIASLAFLTAHSGMVHVIISQVVIGFGFAMFASPNTNAIMSSIGSGSYGFASAAVGTMRQLGMTLSMGITMVVFALVIGKVEITAEHYPAFIVSIKILFTIAAASCFAAIFASLARGNIHGNQEGQGS